jgi:hypothetical protein
MTTRQWLAVALMATVTPLAAGQPLKLRLSQPASMGPTTLIVQVSVEPDADNRLLAVVVDSGEYYRGSEVALGGNQARRSHTFEFRNLPSGSYNIRVVLFGRGAKPKAVADGRTIVY